MLNQTNVASSSASASATPIRHTTVYYSIKGENVQYTVEIPETPDYQICFSDFKKVFRNHSVYMIACKIESSSDGYYILSK